MGERLPGLTKGRGARRRTHLESLLGHKVLHAPNDLDGGPMVLPQPAVENGEERESGRWGARGWVPSQVPPAALGWVLP